MKLPTADGIDDALSLIRPYLDETPLVRSELLSRAMDAEIWIKNETVSPIASFKMRGALADICRARARGTAQDQGEIERVVTASSGNHGQGVAYAAKLLGLGADIFLPQGANPGKVTMIKALGATVHVVDEYTRLRLDARAFASEHGHYFVDDGGSVDLLEGAGTVGLEIARALPVVDRMFVPVGDAALINGAACALKSVHERARVTSVQAAGAPALTESFWARKAVERASDTIADGLATWVPAELALAGMLEFVDDAVLVSEDELLAAIHSLAECAHVLVEPSGAASLAGAWAKRDELAGTCVVLILTGANVTMEILGRALATPPLFSLGEVG